MFAQVIRPFACVLVAFATSFAFLAPSLADEKNGPIVVDRTFVEQAIARGAVIWDVRSANDYAKGHLPGAVSIGDAPKVLRDEVREDFIDLDQVVKALAAAGIEPSREVVVYGSRGGWPAYFGQYTLQVFGAQQVSVYHNGFEDWFDAGRASSVMAVALENAANLRKLGTLSADLSSRYALDRSRLVDTRDMLARLNQNWVQLIDVRTPNEFIGQDIRAIRGGHIPGAINIPYEQNWQDPQAAGKLAKKQASSNIGMQLKDRESLKALYAKLDPRKETVVYCQSGARASLTAGVLQELGFKQVRVYDSSWLGYAAQLDAPANHASFVNVGALNARIGSLQSRIEQLEAERTAAKA